MIWKFLSHHRTVTTAAHRTMLTTAHCICQQTKNPQAGWATIRDVLSTRQMPTHWQTGELPSSLGPKSNQRSLFCTEGGLLKLWDTNPNIFTWGNSVSSTACIGTHLIYFKILMPISITYKPYFSFISPLRFRDMGISIFLDWSLYLFFTPVLLSVLKSAPHPLSPIPP